MLIYYICNVYHIDTAKMFKNKQLDYLNINWSSIVFLFMVLNIWINKIYNY